MRHPLPALDGRFANRHHRPGSDYFLPSTTTIQIDTLRVARLSNTNFVAYGPQLTRLELVAEHHEWRLQPDAVCATLKGCPALQHLSLCMVCDDDDGIVEDAWDPDGAEPVVLPGLTCLVLEDGAAESLVLLSSLKFPPRCDFHWTVIEPFGTLEYSLSDMTSTVSICREAFDTVVSPGHRTAVLVLEVILDFQGRHLETGRDIRQWPEEMRVSLASSEESAMSQFVVQRSSVSGVTLFRDLTASSSSSRRSFGIRSRMLSKEPQEKNQRHHPEHFPHPHARSTVPAHVPRLRTILKDFMSAVHTLDGFTQADTVILPSHAYIPRYDDVWSTMLSHCTLSSLTVGTITNIHELRSLAAYLATHESDSWPHPDLTKVHCPNYIGGRSSEKDFASAMDELMGERRGCTDTVWSAPKLC